MTIAFSYSFRTGWSPPPRPTMASILCAVAERYGVSVEDLKGPRRYRNFVIPRHEAMYEMVERRLWSLPQIGRFMGGRDHTTVLNGWRRHAERMREAAA
jgi:chromosomal replication initiator protein